MRWLNYQHFFYFWNIAQLKSVTEASRKLKLAQPTISAQMKVFEDVLGAKLFEREGRALKLTDTGQMAARYAEQIFGLGQEFLEVLDGKERGGEELKIGISDVVPKSLAYRLIEPALNSDDHSTILCFEDKTERLLADLSIGEISLVIADRPIPTNVKVKAYNYFIGESGVSFLASRTLVKGSKKGFPYSLQELPVLLPTKESALRFELEQWFDKIGLKVRHKGSFQDRALMKIAAREGKGVIPVPTAIASEVMKEFHLCLLGATTDVKEQLYLISVERRLKSPLLIKICAESQKRVFKK